MKKPSLSDFTTHDLVVVHWMEKMEDAFGVMNASQVRHLPVVDDGSTIIGIVSDRDFQRAMQIDQPDFVSGKVARPVFDPNARVRDYMNWPVESIEESRSVADAAMMMLDKRISSLVVTRGARVVGIVTSDDLLRALLEGNESALHDLRVDLQAAIYRSPIGQIAHQLANVGV